MGIHCILGRSISNIMIKTALLVTLFFVGSLTKSTSRNDDMETFLNIVFCACDENQNGSLDHGELNTEVCQVITQHEISSGTFDDVDTNDDGEVTKEEVIDDAVRVIGCVCDTDGSWSLSFDEVASGACLEVQNWIFGDSLDQAAFDTIDTNNDGEISGEEAGIAIEAYFNSHTSA